MEITSITFIILVIVSIFIFYIIPGKFRYSFLALISGLFIASYSYTLLGYILLYAILNYWIGLLMIRSNYIKPVFWFGIVLNLTQLVLLKYHSFLIVPLLHITGIKFSQAALTNIILPLGISYYTLQGIGYLINLAKGWEKPEKNLIHFLLYILFFPKFISGPIERSNKFLPQLNNTAQFEEKQVTEGLRIALLGFVKKVVIANQLGMIVSSAYSGIESSLVQPLWIVLFIQPFYLYFDFSGYSDIAIGFAKTFGIKLSPNFERPFLAENVSQFWRKWHMSLTSWFNDYIFRQLSFRYRKWGIFSSVFAVFVTFSLFGIWHGAGWNFMLLGFIQAIAINYEFFTKKYRAKIFSKIKDNHRTWIGRIATFCFFSGSLVFFFSPNLNMAFMFYKQLFHHNLSFNLHITWSLLFSVTLLCILLFVDLLNQDYPDKYYKIFDFCIHRNGVRLTIYYIAIILIIKYLGGNEVFIYQMF
jgi:alginate O-acetyltransferase complex protein AlgI